MLCFCHKNYIEFKRNFLFLLMKLYLIFIDQAVNCIVDNANGNILTNRKWRSYNDDNLRMNYRINFRMNYRINFRGK